MYLNKLRTVWIMALVSLISLITVANTTAATTDWQAKYWTNKNLSGEPDLVRQEANLDHDWGSGSPGDLNVELFSARFTKTLNVPPGTYRFTATMDDGLRFWVDNVLVIDSWTDSQVHSLSADVYLSSGDHNLKVEYYDAGGAAVAKLSWVAISLDGPGTINNWRGEYFNNKTLSGTPALVRDDANISFTWGSGSPAGNTINDDNFSVRWTRTLANSSAGRYRFTAFVDDGVRVWVNGQLVINAWSDHTPQEFMGDVDFAGGDMNVVVEYYENAGGARINVTRTQLTTVTNPVPSVPAGATATVASQLLNVRQGPSVTNPVIAVLTQGQTVSLLARNAQTTWVQVITPNGVQGWVYAPLLQTSFTLNNLPVGQGLPTTPPPAPSGPTATVSNAIYALNVRSGPGVAFNPITAIQRGTQVTLIGRNTFSTWLKIRLPNGTEGWSSASYLNTNYNISSLPVASS